MITPRLAHLPNNSATELWLLKVNMKGGISDPQNYNNTCMKDLNCSWLFFLMLLDIKKAVARSTKAVTKFNIDRVFLSSHFPSQKCKTLFFLTELSSQKHQNTFLLKRALITKNAKFCFSRQDLS